MKEHGDVLTRYLDRIGAGVCKCTLPPLSVIRRGATVSFEISKVIVRDIPSCRSTLQPRRHETSTSESWKAERSGSSVVDRMKFLNRARTTFSLTSNLIRS